MSAGRWRTWATCTGWRTCWTGCWRTVPVRCGRWRCCTVPVTWSGWWRMRRTARSQTPEGPASVGCRVGDEVGRPGCLVEVEVVGQVTQLGVVLPDAGTVVRPAVGGGVDPLAAQEIVLDEFEVGVLAEDLVVDVPLLGVGADDQGGDAHAVAVVVHRRRGFVVIETAPVVPVEENGGAVPVRAAHDGVDQPCN